MSSALSGTETLYPPTVEAAEKPLPLHRFLFRFVRNPLLSLPRSAYEEPITILRSPMRTVAWISDPALVETVLVTNAGSFEKTSIEKRVFARTLRDGVLTSEGKLWRWQRRSMAPMFRHMEILRYVPAMAEAADALIGRWRQAKPGSIQPIDRAMTETTFAIIARTMLIGGLPAESETIKHATEQALSRISWEIAFAVLRFPPWMPHPATFQLYRSGRRLRAAVGDIIARRLADGAEGDDLLARLLAARDPDSGAPMTRDQLINNLLTLLEAGHETTARALTWTLYLLARSPDWQDKVRREVTAVCGDRDISPEHLQSLVLTQQVLKEAMRLYPPVPVMSRTSLHPMTLHGETLPSGTMIVIPIYCIHRHRRLWSDPDSFDPMRFTPERDAAYPRGQFMPFGAGPRICLGAAFAMAEATVVLASLMRAVRFEWDGKHSPEPISRVTLQPKGGMPLQVTPLTGKSWR